MQTRNYRKFALRLNRTPTTRKGQPIGKQVEILSIELALASPTRSDNVFGEDKCVGLANLQCHQGSIDWRRGGCRGERAWRRRALDYDEIADSPMVCDPLRKFHFCSPSEGAAAMVLCRADIARATKLPRATVSDVVSTLMADGLVTEIGLGVSAGGNAGLLHHAQGQRARWDGSIYLCLLGGVAGKSAGNGTPLFG